MPPRRPTGGPHREAHAARVCISGGGRRSSRSGGVDDHGRAYLVSAPGHRAMLQQIEALPADAEPTRAVADPDLWMMARAAQSLGSGARVRSPLSIADYYAWRTRLYLVRGSRVFELKRDGGVRFALVAALPAGAVPFTEAEAEQLGQDVHDAARRIDEERPRAGDMEARESPGVGALLDRQLKFWRHGALGPVHARLLLNC